MIRRFLALAFLLGAFSFFPHPAHAASGLAAAFDWQARWGSILPDTVISSDLHSIKSAISNAVKRCGVGNTNYGLIQLYTGTLSGNTVYLIDPSAYFTAGESSTCDMKPCVSGSGCRLSIMGPETTSTVTTSCSDDSGSCSETAYNYPLIWENYVLSWDMMSASAFSAFRASALDYYGKPKYQEPDNANPILVVQLASGCTVDEMDMNNDGAIDKACTKYFEYANNTMVDLYSPLNTEVVENDTRYTTKYFDRSVAKIDGTGSSWRSEGTRLDAASNESYQIPNFDDQSGTTQSLMCEEFKNDGTLDLFIPTRTDAEFQSFRAAVASGRLQGVTAQECERKFTPWVGTTACPSNIPCDSTVTIVAERRCQRSSSAYGACSECATVTDSDPIQGFSGFDHACFFKAYCYGTACNSGECIDGQASVLMEDGTTKALADLKIGDTVLGFSEKAPLASLRPVKVVKIESLSKEQVRSRLVTINGLSVTAGHRLLASNGKVVPAANLKVDDRLAGTSGEEVPVTKAKTSDQKQTIYNIVLENADGFVVNGLRLLSHTP
jgi:hypothetical protein